MALNNEQWAQVAAATDALRALGCAVCVFTPDDVESAANDAADAQDDEDGVERGDEDAMTAEQSSEWMARNRKRLEDTLSAAGNEFVADNLNH